MDQKEHCINRCHWSRDGLFSLLSYLLSKSSTSRRIICGRTDTFRLFHSSRPGFTLIWPNAVTRYALSEKEEPSDFTVLPKVVVASIHPIRHLLIRYFGINSIQPRFCKRQIFCEVTRRLDSFCVLAIPHFYSEIRLFVTPTAAKTSPYFNHLSSS